MTFFGSIKHLLLEGRFGCLRSGLYEAYSRGALAARLVPVYWERYLETPLDELRQQLRILPWTEEDRAATAPFRWRGPQPAGC